MGYLINPVGFRVGHTRDWLDVWFCYKDMYPEFLHFVLKIRIFLNFYFCSEPSFKDYEYEDNRLFFKKIGSIINTLKEYFEFLGNLSLLVIRNNFRLKWKELYNSFSVLNNLKSKKQKFFNTLHTKRNAVVFNDNDKNLIKMEKDNADFLSLIKEKVFFFEDQEHIKNLIKDGVFTVDEVNDVFNEVKTDNDIIKGEQDGIFFKNKIKQSKEDLKEDGSMEEEDKMYKLKILDPSFFDEEDLDYNSDFFIQKMNYIKQVFEEKIEQKVSSRFLKKLSMYDIHQILDSILLEVLSMENPNTFYFDGILFSHFKIVLNLHSVFVSVFVYPGKYWDYIYDNLKKSRIFYKRKNKFYLRNKVDNYFLGPKNSVFFNFSRNWTKYGYINSLYDSKDFPFFYDRIFSKLNFNNNKILNDRELFDKDVFNKLKKRNIKRVRRFNRRFFYKNSKFLFLRNQKKKLLNKKLVSFFYNKYKSLFFKNKKIFFKKLSIYLRNKHKNFLRKNKKLYKPKLVKIFSKVLIDSQKRFSFSNKKALFLDNIKMQYKPWSYRKRFFYIKNSFLKKKRSRINFRRFFGRSFFSSKKFMNLPKRLKKGKPFWKKRHLGLRFYYKKKKIERFLKKLYLLRFFLSKRLKSKFNRDFLVFIKRKKQDFNVNNFFRFFKKTGKFRFKLLKSNIFPRYKRFCSFFKYWWKYRFLFKYKIWIRKDLYYSKKREIRKTFVFKKSSFFNYNQAYLKFLKKNKTGFHFLLLFFLFFKPFSIIDNFKNLFNKVISSGATVNNFFFIKKKYVLFSKYNNLFTNLFFSFGYGYFFYNISLRKFYFNKIKRSYFFNNHLNILKKKYFGFFFYKCIFFFDFSKINSFFYLKKNKLSILNKSSFFLNLLSKSRFKPFHLSIISFKYSLYKKLFYFLFKTTSIRKTRLFFFFNYFLKNKLKNNFFRRENLSSLFHTKNNIIANNKDVVVDNFFFSSFYFFLVWVFNRENVFRRKKKSQLGSDLLQFLDTRDWEKENIRRFQIRRFFKRKKFYKKRSKFLNKFFFFNWDFLISFLIDKFFFKYNVDIKYFLIFILFFKDLNMFGQKPQGFSSSLKSKLAVNLLNIHYNNNQLLNFDYSLEPILHKLVPFDNIFVNTFLIHNKHITALFLARYFSIKLLNGHYLRSTVNPVVRELSNIVRKNLSVLNKSNFLDKKKVFSFLRFRTFVFKKLLLKNFFLYKYLYLKFFFFFNSFYNFYLLHFFCFFFSKIKFHSFLILGISKNFFFRKHAYNFFFNYDFNTFLEKVFNFFSLILLNFFSNGKVYFNIILDEIFTSFNVVINANDYFNIDLSSVKTASFFFNKVIIYNYWFYNMTWLHNANTLNKMRARIFPKEPLTGLLYGFKFHFRGRFSRKQRAASIFFQKGAMPLSSMSANIDYSFITMPLVNSLVSIKVWLFKNKGVSDFYKEKIVDKKLLRLDSIFYRNRRLLFYQHFLKNINFKFIRKNKFKKKNSLFNFNSGESESKRFLAKKNFHINLRKKVWFLNNRKIKSKILNNKGFIRRNRNISLDKNKVLFIKEKLWPRKGVFFNKKLLYVNNSKMKLLKEIFFKKSRIIIDRDFLDTDTNIPVSSQDFCRDVRVFRYKHRRLSSKVKRKTKFYSNRISFFLNKKLNDLSLRNRFFMKVGMLKKKKYFYYRLLPFFLFSNFSFFFNNLFFSFNFNFDYNIYWYFFNRFNNVFYYILSNRRRFILKKINSFYFFKKKLGLKMKSFFFKIKLKGFDYITYISYLQKCYKSFFFKRNNFVAFNCHHLKIKDNFLIRLRNFKTSFYFFKKRQFFFFRKYWFSFYDLLNFKLNFFFRRKIVNYSVGFRRKKFKRPSFYLFLSKGGTFFYYLNLKIIHRYTIIYKNLSFLKKTRNFRRRFFKLKRFESLPLKCIYNSNKNKALHYKTFIKKDRFFGKKCHYFIFKY